MLQGSLKDVAFVHVHEFNAGLQIILKLEGAMWAPNLSSFTRPH